MKVPLNSPPNCILDDYTFKAFQVVLRQDTDEPDSLDVECQIGRNEKDREKYLIQLDVDYSAKAVNHFTLRISAQGCFHWRDGLESKEGAGFMAWVNGGTILYGLVRAHVAELTSSCECGRVILPTVMMFDIVKATIKRSEEQASMPAANAAAASSVE